MRYRLLVALTAMIGLTAFAPAPFVKPDRGRDRDTGEPLARLQGVWTITSKTRMANGNLIKYGSSSQKLQINKDGWQFVYGNLKGGIAKGGGPARSLYKLAVEAGHPHRFRVKRTTTDRDYMVGILAFEGKTVKMLYKLASSRPADEQMPTSFDPIPDGWYLMTLEADK